MKFNSICTILFIAITFSFFSCKETQKSDQKEEVSTTPKEVKNNTPEVATETAGIPAKYIAIVYRNTINEIADINLTIRKEGTFIYYMEPLDKVEEGEDVKITTAEGTWTKRDQWIVLNFSDPNVTTSGLFESKQNEDFKIMNDRTVEINSEKKEVTILGIKCVQSIIK